MKHWHDHPGVRTGDELTFGERCADRMRYRMGSWLFVGVFTTGMVVWMATAGFGIDRFPFILLNLALSALAGLQGSIILIAANRADHVAAEVAAHTLTNTETTTQRLDQVSIDVQRLAAAIDDVLETRRARVAELDYLADRDQAATLNEQRRAALLRELDFPIDADGGWIVHRPKPEGAGECAD